jgi:hypothetical protein
MTVAAADVKGWRGKVKVLIISRFHATNEGAEIWQVTEMEVEKIFHGFPRKGTTLFP